LSISFVLSACGGGQGSSTSGPQPILNRAPLVASANADQAGQVGHDYSYDVTQSGSTFSDPDGDSLTITVTLSPDIGLSEANGTIGGILTDKGEVTVTVTATDPDGASVSDSFNIEITIDQDAVQLAFAADINLDNLENYANQPVPDYIGAPRDNGNPVTDAGATLGRVLFYDVSLSIDNTVSCSSCHQQTRAFSDNQVVSQGVFGGVTVRHSMRLINLRFGNGPVGSDPGADAIAMFWDERASSAEDQATQPIRDHDEHGFSGLDGRPNFDALVAKLEGIPYYEELFRLTFLSPEITEEKIQLALAQFVRSIQSFDSKYDAGRAQIENELDDFPNFSPDENAGKRIFATPFAQGGANCFFCHSPPDFVIAGPEEGRGHNGVVGVANDLSSFDYTVIRAPALRDIVGPDGQLNGPLMHNASKTSLRQVIDHYDFIPVPPGEPERTDFLMTIDTLLAVHGTPQDFSLTDTEKNQLESFLRTLTGSAVYTDMKWSSPF
jgi:cytochrome c peroxidase